MTSGAEGEADGVGEFINAGLHCRPGFLVESNILSISPHQKPVFLLRPLPQLACSTVPQSPLEKKNNRLLENENR